MSHRNRRNNKYQIFHKLLSAEDLANCTYDYQKDFHGLEAFVKIFGLDPKKESEGESLKVNELAEILLRNGVVKNKFLLGGYINKYIAMRVARSIVRESYPFETCCLAFYFMPTFENFVRKYVPKIKSTILDIPPEI